ncbi:GNAT family N-acetyltransferase [Hymenobacter sp. BT188]|uniref:GNAT family N-acetyltransferase n=1 Tax=Hymenobacter sp. BT188 TaxID=2763504 RepID=UPI001650E20B|nr:GNAT family N-acetyltransferase [Hymenobacter sp. BT188]MBC6608930.1 GNAT family N-acetyltransferase [Hymenobacter sp. BT188]
MLLRYLRHSEIDLSAWEACIAAAPHALPYACAWWLAATAVRWDAVVEMKEDTGTYASIFPLPIKTRPWGRDVYQPPFTQQLGLITTAASRHRNVLDYLALLPAGRFAHLYLQLSTQNELVAAPTGFKLTPRQTYQLNLAPVYATLLAGYSPDYRRRLGRNQEQPQPLIVTETMSAKAVIQLFKKEKVAVGLKSQEYQHLEALVESLPMHSRLLILEVRAPNSGELLAGALFVYHAHTIIYLFAAASLGGKKVGAPLLLLDHVIQRYAGSPGLVLDFEGGMIPSIARFFANFGATPVPYAALTQTRQPWYLQWMR